MEVILAQLEAASSLAAGMAMAGGVQVRNQGVKSVRNQITKLWTVGTDSMKTIKLKKGMLLAAMPSYGIDTNWYTDTGTTYHVTSELNKLTTRVKYQGQDQIHAANGTGMEISHIGNSSIYSPLRSLQLNDVLHVPNAKINLCSVHKISRDNNVFFEYHPYWFFIKDQATRNTILEGRCERGLYPIKSMKRSRRKVVAGIIKPSVELWHSRLGHPSFSIVDYVLKNNVSCPLLREKIVRQCVMLVKRLRVISFLIRNQTMYLRILLNLFR
jgi:hypothetical protein